MELKLIIMPYTDKDKKNEYNKTYRQNPENKEKIKETQKEYCENNKEKIKEDKKKYNQTESGKKSYRINNWKQMKIICADWNALYERYLNTDKCERCDVELIEGTGRTNHKHLDHNHETGEVRNILCGYCNSSILANVRVYISKNPCYFCECGCELNLKQKKRIDDHKKSNRHIELMKINNNIIKI